MIALMTYSQLTEKHITSNLPAAKFAMYLNEAQEFDLRPLLGDELYIDLISQAQDSPQFSSYSDLMNGNTYTYNDKKYKHEGLVSVLSYYTYSRYLQTGNGINSTPFGVVVKTNDYSQPSSEKTVARFISQAQSGGKVHWERTQRFLIHNKDSYPLYGGYCGSSNNAGQGVRVTAIGGNNNNRWLTFRR